jgi:DNA mismatch repair protein MutL
LVQRAIRHSLLISTPPLLNLSIPLSNPNAGNTMDYAWTVAKETYQNKIDIPRSVDPVEENDPLRPADKLSHIPLLRLIGQIGAAYLVAEGPDGLYLIDQHAAHERILFEKFNKLPVTERPKQQLLDPVTILLNSSDFILILPQIDILNRLGFDVDEFGENTIRVEAIPSLFSQSDPVSLIKSCIEDFEENEIPLSADHEQKIIARICKRSAVKSGQILSQMEQLQLVLDLEQCHSPRTCPHGRPTMIHLSVDLLERQFGRKGSR